MQFEVIAPVDETGIILHCDRNYARYFRKLTQCANTVIITDLRAMATCANRRGKISILIDGAANEIVYTHRDDQSLLVTVRDLHTALDWCSMSLVSRVYVTGSACMYMEAILHPLCERVTVARLPADVPFIRAFGSLSPSSQSSLVTSRERFPQQALGGDTYEVSYMRVRRKSRRARGDGGARGDDRARVLMLEHYDYVNAEENAVKELVSRVCKLAVRVNRTPVSSQSGFGAQLSFSLWHPVRGALLPLLTSKRVVWKSVFHELVWFLRGDNDIAYLHANGVHIWDMNTSPTSAHPLWPAGTVGAAYGHQWRHFGAPVDERGQRVGAGVDQIATLVDGLRTNPTSRRHVVTAWHPGETSDCALPPCHFAFQMFVDVPIDASGMPSLSMMVTMRSCDLFLGLPFNIASYALLTHLLADMCAMRAHRVVFNLGDHHVYANQHAAIATLLPRRARKFPTVRLQNIPRDVQQLHTITMDNVTICDYFPHPFIKCDMVA